MKTSRFDNPWIVCSIAFNLYTYIFNNNNNNTGNSVRFRSYVLPYFCFNPLWAH